MNRISGSNTSVATLRGFSLVEVLIAASLLSIAIMATMRWGSYLNRGIAQSKAVSDRDRILDDISGRIRNVNNLNRTYQMLLALNPAHPFVRCINPNPAAGADCVHGVLGELPIFHSGTGGLLVGTATDLGNLQFPGPAGYSLETSRCAARDTVSCPINAVAFYTPICPAGAATCAQASGIVIRGRVSQSLAFDRIPSALRRLGDRDTQTVVRVNEIIMASPNAICPAGQYVQSINPDNTANCVPLPPAQVPDCLAGNYMEAILPPDGLTARCRPVPQAACGAGNAARGIGWNGAGYTADCTALPQASCPAGEAIRSFNWDGTRVCVPLSTPPVGGQKTCPDATVAVGVDFSNGKLQCLQGYTYPSSFAISQVPGTTAFRAVAPNRPLAQLTAFCPLNYSPVSWYANVGANGIIHDVSFDYVSRGVNLIYGCAVVASFAECGAHPVGTPPVHGLWIMCVLDKPAAQAAITPGNGWF